MQESDTCTFCTFACIRWALQSVTFTWEVTSLVTGISFFAVIFRIEKNNWQMFIYFFAWKEYLGKHFHKLWSNLEHFIKFSPSLVIEDFEAKPMLMWGDSLIFMLPEGCLLVSTLGPPDLEPVCGVGSPGASLAVGTPFQLLRTYFLFCNMEWTHSHDKLDLFKRGEKLYKKALRGSVKSVDSSQSPWV